MNQSPEAGFVERTVKKAVLLDCPECQRELTGLPIDRVFFCKKCGIAVDFWEDPAGITPCLFETCSIEKDETMLFLPVWVYQISVQIESNNQEALTLAETGSPEKVFVFGSIFQKQNLYGDLNLEFGRRQPEIDLSQDPRETLGCQLRRVHADKLVIPVTTSIIDTVQDVTDLSISVGIKKHELHVLSFYLTPQKLVHKTSGISINRNALVMDPWLRKKNSRWMS